VTLGNVSRAVLLLCATAWLMPACGPPSAARKQEAEARMRMGVTYLQQHNLPKAMTELNRAAELDPTNAEVDMMLGLAYRARGDQKEAEQYLREAIDKKPDYAEAHNNLGIVLADRKAWDKAIEQFELAANNVQYATPEWALYNAAEACRAKGDAAKAEEFYRKAIRLNDRYAPAYVGLSSVLGGEERWEEAAAVLRQCVEKVPGYVDGWMALARVYIRLKRPSEAAAAFREVLALSSDPEVRKQASAYLGILEPKGPRP
jgi:type IV pilus biogenesis/stability protein PilW